MSESRIARTRRDVTRALELARTLSEEYYLAAGERSPSGESLVQLLTDLDARTGKRDPSKRKAKP
jgi:hypothetical protein